MLKIDWGTMWVSSVADISRSHPVKLLFVKVPQFSERLVVAGHGRKPVPPLGPGLNYLRSTLNIPVLLGSGKPLPVFP